MPNEGVLFKKEFGGDVAHTEDHPPLFKSGVLAAGHGAIPIGMVIVNTSAGLDAYAIIPATNDVPAHPNGDIAGVVEYGAEPTDTAIVYLIHGTVKSKFLKKAGGTVFTDYAALHAVGIYEV
jgi:hypothetical protein